MGIVKLRGFIMKNITYSLSLMVGVFFFFVAKLLLEAVDTKISIVSDHLIVLSLFSAAWSAVVFYEVMVTINQIKK